MHFFLDPLNLLIISFLIFIFITTRRNKNKFKGTVWFFIFCFILLYKPLPKYLIKKLENRFISNEELLFGLEGLVILGGRTSSGKVAKDRNDYTLGETLERIFKGLEFLKKKPEGTIIFTGFLGKIVHE